MTAAGVAVVPKATPLMAAVTVMPHQSRTRFMGEKRKEHLGVHPKKGEQRKVKIEGAWQEAEDKEVLAKLGDGQTNGWFGMSIVRGFAKQVNQTSLKSEQKCKKALCKKLIRLIV